MTAPETWRCARRVPRATSWRSPSVSRRRPEHQAPAAAGHPDKEAPPRPSSCSAVAPSASAGGVACRVYLGAHDVYQCNDTSTRTQLRITGGRCKLARAVVPQQAAAAAAAAGQQKGNAGCALVALHTILSPIFQHARPRRAQGTKHSTAAAAFAAAWWLAQPRFPSQPR